MLEAGREIIYGIVIIAMPVLYSGSALNNEREKRRTDEGQSLLARRGNTVFPERARSLIYINKRVTMIITEKSKFERPSR
jgi:hypothetical protein